MNSRRKVYLISFRFSNKQPPRLHNLSTKNAKYLNILGRWSGLSSRRKTPLIYWTHKEEAYRAATEIIQARMHLSMSVFVVDLDVEDAEIAIGFKAYRIELQPCLWGYIKNGLCAC